MSRQSWPRQEEVCRDRASLYRDIVGQSKENFYRDREFSVATELAMTESSVAYDRAGRAKASAHD